MCVIEGVQVDEVAIGKHKYNDARQYKTFNILIAILTYSHIHILYMQYFSVVFTV